MPRLLICHDCHSVEQLPDYTGPKDERGMPLADVLLDDLCTRHRFPNGEEHKGKLVVIDQAAWDQMNAISEVQQELLRATGEMYADRDTYREDAGECFNRHGRPELALGCPDYLSDEKRIGNPTHEGWERGKVKVFLCHFCPYQSEVTTAKRHRKGMYR